MIAIEFCEIGRALKELKLPYFDLVIGIASGGVVPASLVAYKIASDMRIVSINYRGPDNSPCRHEPLLVSEFNLPEKISSILLVDDVSVSGKTLEYAKGLFPDHEVKTFVLKGKADYVLFPQLDSCVKWPWKA